MKKKAKKAPPAPGVTGTDVGVGPIPTAAAERTAEGMTGGKGEMVERRVVVDVSERDIARAQKNDSFKCVVAQAVARTLPDAHHIEVDSQCIRFSQGQNRFIYPTPPAVQGYVVAFDAGEVPEPFRFHLRYARRVSIRRPVATPKKKAADRATWRVRAAAKRAGKTPDKRALKAAYRQASQRYPDQPATVTKGAGRRPTPRVYRTGIRVYGQRVMRINWTDEQKATHEAELAARKAAVVTSPA